MAFPMVSASKFPNFGNIGNFERILGTSDLIIFSQPFDKLPSASSGLKAGQALRQAQAEPAKRQAVRHRPIEN